MKRKTTFGQLKIGQAFKPILERKSGTVVINSLMVKVGDNSVITIGSEMAHGRLAFQFYKGGRLQIETVHNMDSKVQPYNVTLS